MRRLRLGFLLAAVLLLSVFVSVRALTVFVDDSLSGPTPVASGDSACPYDYQYTVQVESMTPPDHVVCVDYSVWEAGTNPPVLRTSEVDSCTLTAPGPPDEWTCVIPCQANADIDFEIAGWSAGGGTPCGDWKSPGFTGEIGPTGPLAITVNQLGASAASGFPASAAAGALVLLGGVAVGGVFAVRRRNH